VAEVPIAEVWPPAANTGRLGETETTKCFHVVGFDVMLSEGPENSPVVHLLEVRQTPC
jgi:hypothetical protein